MGPSEALVNFSMVPAEAVPCLCSGPCAHPTGTCPTLHPGEWLCRQPRTDRQTACEKGDAELSQCLVPGDRPGTPRFQFSPYVTFRLCR